MARPSKLTPEIHERIVQLVKAGMFLKDAAAFSQVGERTLYDWLERGQMAELQEEMGEPVDEDERRYAEFSQAIEEARAYANITDMNVIGMAAQDDPTWAERRLKLRNPWMFKQEHRVEVMAKTPAQVRAERQAQMLERATLAIEKAGRMEDV